MHINKLTITPLNKGFSPFVQYGPTCDTAGILIKERLASGRNERIPRAMKKIPKFLKGFVNPDTKFIRENKINSFI